MEQRFKHEGVRSYAVHPGGIFTPLQRHLPKEEMIALGWIDEAGNVPETALEAALAFFKTPPQGTATTLWCAVNLRLQDIGGVYCEDCNIAQVADDDAPRYLQVAPHAVDEAAAEKLWQMTEAMLNDV